MTETTAPTPMDLAVSFPARGAIRLQSRSLFAEPGNDACRRFLERVFQAAEIEDVTINSPRDGVEVPHADLRFRAEAHKLNDVVNRISGFLDPDRVKNGQATTAPANGRAPHSANGRAAADGREHHGVAITKVTPVRNAQGRVRFFRYGSVVTDWEIKHELPGRLRLMNPAIHRKAELCQAIERELMSVLGVDSYKTNPLTSTVLVKYDIHALTRDQVIEIIDGALAAADHPETKDKPDLHLPICTISMPVAAVAQFAAPVLLPAAAVLFAYTSIPTFKSARAVIVEERRLGVDVLDAIVVLGCLGTMSIFPGAVLCWCLGFGQVLVKKTQDDSKKLLLNAFGKQPRFVWLYRDGVEVQVSLDRLQAGDVIVVNTGEVVPVDGIITEGLAMVDQHALTGESTPAEKGVGDRVFASTLMVAGKMLVSVEKSGSETASAKISRILTDTAGYKLNSQHKGERLADRAVIPTLTIGAIGMATMGPAGAVAVLNSDFGTGIRMAAPLAMLSTLALCASKGILVKDGRALELMNEIDTVLFDKTGTLTRERPEVGLIVSGPGCTDDQILLYAAAAEKKFHHPIALAILHKAQERNLELPETDDSQYKVGYGITVNVDGRTIRVGSKRFMELEGLPMCNAIREALEEAHREGHTMVMVGVDDQVGGAIALHAAVRPEVRDIIKGLRDRGIKHIAIISGDHEAPTKKLAESLGMDRYFAQVLPADKADYVEKLQKEGRKVCFVGDGINDSIALKKANVSISLRGASSIATDTAHIVFMEQGLSKLCDLRDISRDLDRNVKRSWKMILVPNIACIAGVFTMGFGIMASVLTNNVAAIGALANGMAPLRKIAQIEAEKKHEQELRQAYGLEREAL
ncbi:heavy metal translocating P-type ATPase [Paludisphaera borealis]|uniref:P-type Zn(2+) transporter n=1 Tax=Paludisphaera borealis TaxID=1387353 RepID=A0A1U7CQU6_9BACT|nr:heavy metal translocating P-type ATPase [Paludisphaera borealis]APW61269.1 putative copper-exporting P-type ATPase V [Paludisphaera borealis]